MAYSDSPDENVPSEQNNVSHSLQPMSIQNLLINNDNFQRPPGPALSSPNPTPTQLRSPQGYSSPSSVSSNNPRLNSGNFSFSPESTTVQTRNFNDAPSPNFNTQPVRNFNQNHSALFLSQFRSSVSPMDHSNPISSGVSEYQRPISPRNNNSPRSNGHTRDESGLSYDLSRLVAPSGAEASRSTSLSPHQAPLHTSFLGGTAAQRLPSISPIDLENNLTQSPMESPITRDLTSPNSRTNFNLVPRSPTSRRLKTSLDALTRRYFRQVMYGCPQENCGHAFCASNPNFTPRDIKEATALSITLSQHGEEYVCSEVPEFDPCDNNLFPVPLQKTLRMDLAQDPRKRHRNIKSWASLDKISSLDIHPNLQLEDLQTLQAEAKRIGDYEPFTQLVYTIFSRVNLLSASYSQKDEKLRSSCPLDIEQVRLGYEFITKECPKVIGASILSGTATLFDKLKLGLEVIREQQLPALFIVLLNPLLMDPSNHHEILPKFCDIFSGLCDKYISIFTNYIIAQRFVNSDPEFEKRHRSKDFQHIVSVLQQFITMRLLAKTDQTITPNKDEFVMKATTCLGILCNSSL